MVQQKDLPLGTEHVAQLCVCPASIKSWIPSPAHPKDKAAMQTYNTITPGGGCRTIRCSRSSLATEQVQGQSGIQGDTVSKY